jgi:hypothetical protein
MDQEATPTPPSAVSSETPSPAPSSATDHDSRKTSCAGSLPTPDQREQQGDALPPTEAKPAAPSADKPKENPLKTALGSTTAMLTAIGTILAAITALLTALNDASWMRPPTPTPMATPTVTSAWTATPHPSATPTLIATAPSVEQISTPALAGAVLREDFHQPPLDWLLEERSDYAVDVIGGELRIRVYEPDAAVWVRVPGTCLLEDVVVEVSVRLAEGSEEGDGGITVREGEDSHLTALLISGDGWYRVEHLAGDTWEPIIAWTESTAIRQGQVNRLRVEVVGSQMRFLINDALVAEFEDASASIGCVGLMAVSWDDAFIEARFDNLFVSAP